MKSSSYKISIENKAQLADFIERCQKYGDNTNKINIKIDMVINGKKRSLKQNRYYWSVVIGESVKFYAKNFDKLIMDAMAALKLRVTPDFISWLFKMLFNGGKSTTRMSTKKMEDYHLKITSHMASYGCEIPQPNEECINQLLD